MAIDSVADDTVVAHPDAANCPVTPSLAQLAPERLAAVVLAYRHELKELAERQAYHACAWALEAIDTLVEQNLRLKQQLKHCLPAQQARASAAPRRPVAASARRRASGG
ncbi:MAG TPA: hypothetical protein VHB98_05025 [Chloroflexota bacterium]|nr:hypothetical protein [Chloroflexota bacterium]